MTRVFLGLGTNVGDREEHLRSALRRLAARCRIVAVSSLYRSAAIVLRGDASGPDYLNAVCEIETDLPPSELLAFAKEIEHAIGRRPAARWAPRPIDIDILLYGDETIDTPELTVPHPRIAQRSFVVVPLAELAPDAMVTPLARTAGELAEDADYGGLEHIAGPEWAEILAAPSPLDGEGAGG